MVVIGLGSNLQRPLQQLRRACQLLAETPELQITAYSNIYQSKAIVPKNAPAHWADKAYLNAAVRVETSLTPEALLTRLKQIESIMGRTQTERWAPRLIDLDVLVFDDISIETPTLTLPHQELLNRPFALIPLFEVAPNYQHREHIKIDLTALKQASDLIPLPHVLAGPQIIGILNITPDSFADGGRYFAPEAALLQAQNLFALGADIIDIGAESTRPGAKLLDIKTEWQRLEPVLKRLHQHWYPQEHRPLISIDTRHAQIIEQALNFGIDWINDVSQEEFAGMSAILKNTPHLQYIAMQHLSVPAIKDEYMTQDPILALHAFQATWTQRFAQAGLAPERLILDPGLGFGKSVMQQLAIIKRFHELSHQGNWLVGHSRKSFLKGLLIEPNEESKETATAMISAYLAKQGVKYLRVHAPNSSLAAIRLNPVLLST